jgi:hypothetical protein
MFKIKIWFEVASVLKRMMIICGNVALYELVIGIDESATSL